MAIKVGPHIITYQWKQLGAIRIKIILSHFAWVQPSKVGELEGKYVILLDCGIWNNSSMNSGQQSILLSELWGAFYRAAGIFFDNLIPLNIWRTDLKFAIEMVIS